MSAGRTWWRDDLSREEVVALLAAYWTEGAFCQLERVDAVVLQHATADWLHELRTAPASLWPQGRMFHQTSEVRWEAASGVLERFQALVVGDASLAAPGNGWAEETLDIGPERHELLWGERRPGDAAWTEDRIPKPQHYPVIWSADRPLAALVTQDYMQRGIVRLTRYIGVEAVARPEVRQ